MKDWDKELAKIDKQLGSLPDEALLPAVKPAAAAPAAVPATRPAAGGMAGVVARLALVTALGVGMLFWPYSARCGTGLLAYLAAVGVLIAGGGWTAIWTWRQRAARAHLVSLLLMLWGGTLAAMEVLPRLGYAIPTETHPAIWMCQ
ncbi:MAG TPA: hypothetical protein VF981_15675 [Gemmatimonadaceae bacterium]